MSLVVGQNSWVTVLEADEYLGDHLSAIEWFALPDAPTNPGEEAKETLLVSAFRWIMGCGQFSLLPSLTDDFVKNAQIEAALFLHEHYIELNERRAAIATGVKEYAMGKRREWFDPSTLKIPDYIAGMLTSYGSANDIVELKGEYDA